MLQDWNTRLQLALIAPNFHQKSLANYCEDCFMTYLNTVCKIELVMLYHFSNNLDLSQNI